MSNLKKFTASVAALSIAMSIVSPVAGVNAAVSGNVDAANRLAKAGVIADQSTNATAYRLGDNITRGEMAKVQANLAGISPATTCKGSFKDVSATKPNTWVCGYVEALLDAGMLAKNATFRPNDKVTKAEALKMVMSAKKMNVTVAAGQDWQVAYVDAGVKAGIVSSFSDFKSSAVRDFVFSSADSVTTAASTVTTDCDAMCVLEKLLNGDAKDTTGTDANTTKPTTSTDTTTSTGTTSTGTVVVTGGDLGVSLAATTPASATLPSSAEGVKVATYDLTAGSKDISVSSVTLKRAGIGSNVTVSRVALFANGSRASNDKTFNSSSDEATIYFTKPLVVKAGSTVSVDVVGEMGDKGANNEFTIQLVKVESSAANINGSLPLSANIMKVSSTSASELVLSNDGTVSDVKLGQTGTEIFKFKAKNDASTEDMTISSITLKEDGTIDETTELANVKLFADGTEVASIEKLDSKYVTFNLKTPLFVKAGKTVNFLVKADITGGAGDYIRLYMDKDLDVSATGNKNGYISIKNSINSTTLASTYDVDVLAGALSLVTVEPTVTELRKDKDDNVLGTIKITSNAGKSLELQKFKTTITEVAALAAIDGVAGSVSSDDYALENVELYNAATKETFDLDCVASGKDAVCSSTSLNIALANGSTTELQLRADTTNNNLTGYKLRASVSNIGTAAAADFYVVETADDKQVTDITPSSITFKTLEVKASGVSVNTLSMSSSKSAVVGSKDVSMLEFEVKADSTSAITLDEVKVTGTVDDKGTVGTKTFDKSRVTKISLYKDSISDANLIKSKSASDISSNVITFDSFKVIIAKSATQKFVVAVDYIDDVNQATDTLNLALTSLSVNDDENDDIITGTVNGVSKTLSTINNAPSARIATIKGAGNLSTVVYTSESPLNNEQNILGNTTSPIVAAYELTALNEAVKVKDLHIVDTAGTLKNGVKTVILLKSDKTTEIARKSVSSSDVFFDDVNYIVAEGTEKIYVKVETSKIGKDEAGSTTTGSTLKLQVTDAEGSSSSKVVTNPVDTAAATAFYVVPVRVSSLSVAESRANASLADGAETLVAKVKVGADSTTNTKVADGSTLKTNVKELRFKLSTFSNLTGTGKTAAFTLKRVSPLDGTNNAIVSARVGGGANIAAGDSIVFDLTSSFGNNGEIVGEATYEVYATLPVTTTTSDAYLELEATPTATAANKAVLFGDDDSSTTENLYYVLTDAVKFGQLKYSK